MNIQQTPVAQRPGGCQCPPVRIGKQRKSQSKGGIVALGIVLRQGAQNSHLWIQLDRGAQQQDVLLKAG